MILKVLIVFALSCNTASVVLTEQNRLSNFMDECIPKQLYSALGNSYYYASQTQEISNLENNDAIIVFTTKASNIFWHSSKLI